MTITVSGNGLIDSYSLTLPGGIKFSAIATPNRALFLFNSNYLPLFGNHNPIDSSILANLLPAGQYYLYAGLPGSIPFGINGYMLFSELDETKNQLPQFKGNFTLYGFGGTYNVPLPLGPYTVTINGATISS